MWQVFRYTCHMTTTRRADHLRRRIARLRRAHEDLAIEIAALEDDLARVEDDHIRFVAQSERQMLVNVDRERNQSGVARAADFYGVSVSEVLSESREPLVVRARQAGMWLLRARGVSFTAIGRVFNRDHTTVMFACEKIDRDPALRALLWPLLEREE